MTNHQEDEWELGINLDLRLRNNIFQRKAVYSMPDKELDLACERYKYPYQHYYSDDDDTNSSVTSGTLSEIGSTLNDIDDFICQEPKIIRTSALNYDFSNFPGVVQKISTNRAPEIQDNDDWNDDIELPNKGILSLNNNKNMNNEKIYDQHLSLDDDDEVLPTISKSIEKRPLNKFHYAVETEEDDMSGLDFPTNMNVLPKRLDEKKKLPTVTFASKPSIKTIPKSKFLSHREKEDDDFFDGLHIKEKTFNSTSMPSRLVQPNNIRTTKSKEFVSRLARPSPLLNTSNKQSDHAIALSKRSNLPTVAKPKIPIPSRQTFSSGTKASRQREAEIAAKKSTGKSLISAPLIFKKSLQKPSVSNIEERKSPIGYTLIAKPKTKKTPNYCSRLDNIDNLNDLPSKQPNNRKFVFNQSKIQSRTEKKSEPDRPWRRNMQTEGGVSRVKLIQPNEQKLQKEYNDMKYDDITHSWKGNETSLMDFQEKPIHRRPMLIMNKQQKNSPSRYAAVVGSSMIFNTDLQKWVSAKGSESEYNELDSIEDLKDELLFSPPTSCSRNISRSAILTKDKSHEFILTVERKRAFMSEQEEHENFMEYWSPKSFYF